MAKKLSHRIFDVLSIVGVILILAAIVLASATVITNVTDIGPKYQRTVHSYVDQAYWTNDPQLIKENLTKAVHGMHDLGLTDSMSWKLFSWDQLPSESMRAQYGQMQALINLCDKALALDPTSPNYSFNYVQATTQIHNTICTVATNGDSHGNWCDEVANGAFWLNLYAWNCWQAYVIGLILFVIGLALLFFFGD